MKQSANTKLSGWMWVIAALLLSLVIWVRYLDPDVITHARNNVYDVYQVLKPREYQPVPVRVVDIDEESLAEFGQWPWPRGLVAKLVDRLTELGAAVIAFDILFSEPDRLSPNELIQSLNINNDTLTAMIKTLPNGDELLAASMNRSPIVLGIGSTEKSSQFKPKAIAGFAHAGANPEHLVKQYPAAIGKPPSS